MVIQIWFLFLHVCRLWQNQLAHFKTNFHMQDDGPGEYQPIPLDKIEDFGVHCKQYLGIVHSVRSLLIRHQ